MQKEMTAFRTIREVAEIIDVPQHVLRFWETRFHEIKPLKHHGGRRYYSPEDIDLLKGIRHLLYGEGYTIRGVQRVLREEGAQSVRYGGRISSPQLPQPPLISSQEDILPNPETSALEVSYGPEKQKSEADQLSGTGLESDTLLPLNLPFKSHSRDEGKILPTPVRSLPKSPLPPPPQTLLPPPELFLGFELDPTPRTKMGDEPHFHTSSEREAFLRCQLREALDHLKECKRMLGLVITPEVDPSQNTS